MDKYTHDLIVIGGGAAGLTLTSGAAQLGMKVVIIEREHMGGDCLYFGCVPSKSILKSSSVYSWSGQMEKYGLPEQKKPQKAEADLLNRSIGKVIENIAPHDSPERFRELGAEVIEGNPSFLNDHEVAVETESGTVNLSAPKISIATGSSALVIPFPGLEETGYITNREIFSLGEIPQRLLVIGAGPIGVEMGQAMVNLGSEVSLLTNIGQILPVEDKDMADWVETSLKNRGVRILYEAEVKRVYKEGKIKKVDYLMGGKPYTWEGDEILIATGRKGNIEDLALENAGIETDGRFIKVNSSLQTSRKHIMAIGDVNGKFLFTHVAGAEGGIAVRRQALGLPAKMNYSNVPWVTYASPEIASIGYNIKRAEKAGISYRTIEAEFSENDRAQAERATEGMIRIMINKRDVVIGTQICGPHAGELLSPAIYAVNGGWKISKLYNPMLPYPTLTEVYKKAIGGYIGVKLFNPKTRKLLRVIKGYRGPGPK